MNTKKYEKLLLDEKNNIINLVSEMNDNTLFGNTTHHTSEKYTTGELSSYDNHLADLGTEVFMQEMQNSLTNHEKYKLSEIDNALYKIKNNTYGICERCSNNIEKERLDFIPETRYCISCSKEVERPVNNIESVSVKDNFSGPNLFTQTVEELVDINRDNKQDY